VNTNRCVRNLASSGFGIPRAMMCASSDRAHDTKAVTKFRLSEVSRVDDSTQNCARTTCHLYLNSMVVSLHVPRMRNVPLMPSVIETRIETISLKASLSDTK